MNPRITSIENLIASDPGERNVFGLVMTDQLRLAAQSLRLAKRVGIVSGFYVPDAGAGETDGPPGAKILGGALEKLGIPVEYITDEWNAPLFRALGIEPTLIAGSAFQSGDAVAYIDSAQPTHLVSIERVGRGSDGRYRNMRGVDITDVTAPLDELFIEGSRRGLTTIGIGDGGNEIGMGTVFSSEPQASARTESQGNVTTQVPETPRRLKPAARCVVATDFCIAAGVSNWGAFGLAGALSVFEGRDLLPPAQDVERDLELIVRVGGAVDGVTHRHETTSDGQTLFDSLRMLENIRRQITPSPLASGSTLNVGILGYGETGRAAAALIVRHGHRVFISDEGPVTLDPGMTAAGVQAGGHTIEFFTGCDLVVASPGVRLDRPVISALHRCGIPVMSELELAFQLGNHGGIAKSSSLIAVTGTIGKRTTVELLQRLFLSAGRSLAIGGNRGRPLSDLLLNHTAGDPIAVAVSSFQLETVVHFRPHVAVVLNIDEAHLDRHRSVAEYIRIKSRVFMNQGPDNALILPFDDERVRSLARKHHGRTLFVSCRQAVDRGAWLTDGRIRMNVEGSVEEVGPADTLFAENLLAAVVTARLYGICAEDIRRALEPQRGEGGSA